MTPRVALLTLYHDNYQPLADVVLPRLQAYCDRHGYTLLAHRGQLGPGAIGFQKLRYLYGQLFGGDRFDLALVTDLDICITNETRRIEDFAAPYPDHDYLVTKDVNGINNGSFIIRRTDWTCRLLEWMLTHHQSFTNEQDVLKQNEAALVAGRLKILPHPSINSLFYDLYPQYGDPVTIQGNWKPGDYLLHLPGIQLEQRLSLLTSSRVLDSIITS